MQQIAPHITTLKNVQVEADKAEAKRLRKQGLKVTGREYLETTHRYRLSITDKLTDDLETMTGYIAKKQNALFFQLYISGKEKHLKKWVWLRKQEQETKSAVSAILEMRRGS